MWKLQMINNTTVVLDKLSAFERLVISTENEFSDELAILGNVSQQGTVDNLKRILRKLSKYCLEKKEKLFNEVFKNITTDRAKQIAKQYVNTIQSVDPSLTYGEIEFFSFVHILQRCRPISGDIFVDLGHGTGKPLVAAALLYGDRFSKIHGIEIVPQLFEESASNIARYKSYIQDRNEFQSLQTDVSVEMGDFFEEIKDLDSFQWLNAGGYSSHLITRTA